MPENTCILYILLLMKNARSDCSFSRATAAPSSRPVTATAHVAFRDTPPLISRGEGPTYVLS